MTIQVTAEDIAMGTRGWAYYCPIALAWKRQSGHRAAVSAGSLKDTHTLQWHSLPRSAQRFIKAFDNGKPVEPFEFKIDLEG